MNIQDILIIIIVDAIACLILSAIVASQKNAGIYGAVIGLFFGPMGVLVACFLDNRNKCPACAERLNDLAKICPHCDTTLSWVSVSTDDDWVWERSYKVSEVEKQESGIKKNEN